MAKKAVATFAAKAGAKSMVKCIRMDKSPKTGAYVFTELLVEADKTKISSRTKIVSVNMIAKAQADSVCAFFGNV